MSNFHVFLKISKAVTIFFSIDSIYKYLNNLGSLTFYISIGRFIQDKMS